MVACLPAMQEGAGSNPKICNMLYVVYSGETGELHQPVISRMAPFDSPYINLDIRVSTRSLRVLVDMCYFTWTSYTLLGGIHWHQSILIFQFSKTYK